MSSSQGSSGALEAALIVRARDRERAERELVAALAERDVALARIDELRLAHLSAKEELKSVWNSVSDVGRLKALRAGGSAQLAQAGERVALAEFRGEVAEEIVTKCRKSLSGAAAAEEAIRRVLNRKEDQARLARLVLADEDTG